MNHESPVTNHQKTYEKPYPPSRPLCRVRPLALALAPQASALEHLALSVHKPRDRFAVLAAGVALALAMASPVHAAVLFLAGFFGIQHRQRLRQRHAE